MPGPDPGPGIVKKNNNKSAEQFLTGNNNFQLFSKQNLGFSKQIIEIFEAKPGIFEKSKFRTLIKTNLKLI